MGQIYIEVTDPTMESDGYGVNWLPSLVDQALLTAMDRMESQGDVVSWRSNIGLLVHGDEDRLKTLAASLRGWKVRSFPVVEPLPPGARLADGHLRKLQALLEDLHRRGATRVRLQRPGAFGGGGPSKATVKSAAGSTSFLVPFDSILAFCEARNRKTPLLPAALVDGAAVEDKVSDRQGLTYTVTFRRLPTPAPGSR